jgi:acyl-CoA thioester hydrolase
MGRGRDGPGGTESGADRESTKRRAAVAGGAGRFACRVRVRWAEADLQGIVFNGHYLTYADVGLTEYLRAIGMPMPVWSAGPGIELFAVKTTAEYHAPAMFDDVLELRVKVGRIGRSSLQFLVAIHRVEPAPAAHLTSIELIYCSADRESRRAVPVPEGLRRRIAAYQGADPSVPVAAAARGDSSPERLAR